MRLPVVVVLITALTGAAAARTIIIETDPSGAEVWLGGECLGEAPVTLDGPTDEPLTLTVKKPESDGVTHVIEVPDDGEDHIFVLSAVKPKKNNTFPIITGIAAGFLLALALLAAIL
ncbi:MAG: PEGA domain-containing protein [bacterium]|nr:PEGA domain-containing protein [bacterium]